MVNHPQFLAKDKTPHARFHYLYLYTILMKQERTYFYVFQETTFITHAPIHCATDIMAFFFFVLKFLSWVSYTSPFIYLRQCLGFSPDITCHFFRDTFLDYSSFILFLYYFSIFTITKCHRVGSLNNRILFSKSPEG